MLGFLYPGNVSPSGQPFDGLTGTESNPGSDGKPVTVFRIEPATPSAYYMPGADPAVGTVSHLESIRAELISRRYPAGVTAPPPPGPLSA